MRYLLISFLFLASCAPAAYKGLRPTQANKDCVLRFAPKTDRLLFKTNVDVVGNHLSGILFVKNLADSSTRILFTNEAGFTYFDFEFDSSGNFKVHQVFDKLNKKSVLKTLEKNFRLIFWNGLSTMDYMGYTLHDQLYHRFKRGKNAYYYITTANCDSLIRMERGSVTKKILEATYFKNEGNSIDSIGIHHTNFNFDIGLKTINDHAEE